MAGSRRNRSTPADRIARDEEIRMTSQSEAERDKAVVDAFYQAGMHTLAIRVSS
jgi:hypothetical protein